MFIPWSACTHSCLYMQLTLQASPYNAGLPINTALAPSAIAFNTSVPCLMPPSTYTSTPLPSTSWTIPGRASIYLNSEEIYKLYFINNYIWFLTVAGSVSSFLPP